LTWKRHLVIGLTLFLSVFSLVWGVQNASGHVNRSPHKWAAGMYMKRTQIRAVRPFWACTSLNEGQVAVIYDSILGAWVHVICRCPNGNCRWYKIRFTNRAPILPGAREVVRRGRDTHTRRVCDSVICHCEVFGHSRNYRMLVRNW